MSPDRTVAYRLRLKGHSYNEIHKTLGVPKSTLSMWLRDVVLSDKAQKRLMGRARKGALKGLMKRNKLQTHKARQRAHIIQTEASATVPHLGKDELLVMGAVLYWAEGYKRAKIHNGIERTAHPVSFVNSDPDMIRTFIVFLISVLGVRTEDIRLTMRLYNHMNESKARQYWSQVTKLDTNNFRNSTFLVTGASKGKRPFNRLPHGTLQVAVYSTEKFHQLMGLIEGVKDRIENDIVRARLPG